MARLAVITGVLVLVVALAGCRHHVTVTVPTGPTRWILDPDASDADQFCVPTDVHLPCVSVATIRSYVRDMRSADE